jgi:hypothetical protein
VIALLFVAFELRLGNQAGGFEAHLVQVPISAEAIADEPLLANAQTWQLRVTAAQTIYAIEVYVRLSGATFYQYPPNFGSDSKPPSAFFTLFPALEFDSYLSMPTVATIDGWRPRYDYEQVYGGPYGFIPTEGHLWGHTLSDGAASDYPFAQITILPTSDAVEQQWIARFFEAKPEGGAVERVVTFPESLGSPFGADVNLDFHVDSDDLAAWSASFGATGNLPEVYQHLDVDSDGDIDDFELVTIVQNFGNPQPTREQGDVDGDGNVDPNDYKKSYQINYGRKWNFADIDQDRDVDGNDFLQWQRLLGAGFTPASTTTVPEGSPAEMLTLVLVAWGFLERRRLLL